MKKKSDVTLRAAKSMGSVTLACLTVLSFLTGCGKSAGTSQDIPAASFRADPSKMTPAEKQKMEQMMQNSGKPASK